MMNKIRDSYPGLHVSGYHHGFFTNPDLINEQIQTQKPDLVFVAMGAPKQEIWIANNLHQFEKGIFIGVGGSFDVLSGEQKRSPQYLQNIHLEWLFRIMNRPHKLKKFRTLAMFSILIFRNYLTMLWDKDIGIEEIE
ncbi:WecB/TagA/CpsF family glycosyltransferase [Leptospira santarosai]|nr:WecB/TagA/CpsF family glycosyltransferase [Leptospira santarosai]